MALGEGVPVSDDLKNWRSGKAPTRDEVLAEIGRELALRRNVFPRWVEAGKITQKQADERIDRLQAGHDWIMEHWPRDQKALFA